MAKAKPFIKWVGGKGQLIDQLDELLPADFGNWEDATYIEPFVGGGAMLFYMLQRYPNIKQAIINDVNADLITCYRTVRDHPQALIASLREVQKEYDALRTEEERKDFFLKIRTAYNQKGMSPVENTTKFFFLNRTCFNGLYRVNKKGAFNVPFGRYSHPLICDEDTIWADSALLQKVEIRCGDFAQTAEGIQSPAFFYFDPPYRPLSDTSSFSDYTKEGFNDEGQVRLKEFCDLIHRQGGKFLLSNSDSRNEENGESFFDALFADYQIERVWASRSINSNPSKRGKLTEIVVRNYEKTKREEVASGLTQDTIHSVAEKEKRYGKGF